MDNKVPAPETTEKPWCTCGGKLSCTRLSYQQRQARVGVVMKNATGDTRELIIKLMWEARTYKQRMQAVETQLALHEAGVFQATQEPRRPCGCSWKGRHVLCPAKGYGPN